MSATNEAGETSDKEAPKSGVGPRMVAMNRHGDRDRAARLMGATQDPKHRTRPEDFFPENPISPPQPIRKYNYADLIGQDNNNTPADIVEDANEQSLPPLLGEGFPRIHANNVEAHVKAAIPGRYFSGKSESERSSTQPPTIYTVPRQLAMSNPSAYTPCAVRLGFIGLTEDFRSKIKTPGNIEKYKMCCVRRLITGRRQAGPSQEDAWTPADRRLLHQCLATLKHLVPRIRAAHDPQAVNAATLYYDYDNDDLMASHSLRDGCFVLHRLLKYARIARRAEQGSGGDDEDEEDDDWTLVFGQCWVWGFVTYDLLLLQNQIPFFVLHALFDLLKTHPEEREDVLVTGALQLFRSLHPHGQHNTPIACRNVHHLLHLFYLSVSFPTPMPRPAPGDLRASTRQEHVLPSELPLWVPCARELDEVGVTLRARKSGAVSFLDVRFHGGVLEIPPLQLYDYSESMFRNLIAFEQTYPATPGHITAYASFMACLVTSHEDMRLLHQSGILVNQMSSGDRDATRFFGSISAQAHTSVDLNYLAGVMEEVVKYQSGSWPRWRASLVRNYFSNPWVITSVVAAVFLLCLTVVQSFFAAYAYFKPPAS